MASQQSHAPRPQYFLHSLEYLGWLALKWFDKDTTLWTGHQRDTIAWFAEWFDSHGRRQDVGTWTPGQIVIAFLQSIDEICLFGSLHDIQFAWVDQPGRADVLAWTEFTENCHITIFVNRHSDEWLLQTGQGKNWHLLLRIVCHEIIHAYFWIYALKDLQGDGYWHHKPWFLIARAIERRLQPFFRSVDLEIGVRDGLLSDIMQRKAAQ